MKINQVVKIDGIRGKWIVKSTDGNVAKVSPFDIFGRGLINHDVVNIVPCKLLK